ITPHGRFVPDITVTAPGVFDSSPSWAESGGVELVVEVTSGRAEKDRKYKRLGYAEAGIPLYLLVDRDKRQVILFGEPDGGDYRASSAVEFGGKLRISEPFDLLLDTERFPS
ncbi:MAG: Uma2 family endonuclease, partial [Stackebrandtia sp.]